MYLHVYSIHIYIYIHIYICAYMCIHITIYMYIHTFCRRRYYMYNYLHTYNFAVDISKPHTFHQTDQQLSGSFPWNWHNQFSWDW